METRAGNELIWSLTAKFTSMASLLLHIHLPHLPGLAGPLMLCLAAPGSSFSGSTPIQTGAQTARPLPSPAADHSSEETGWGFSLHSRWMVSCQGRWGKEARAPAQIGMPPQKKDVSIVQSKWPSRSKGVGWVDKQLLWCFTNVGISTSYSLHGGEVNGGLIIQRGLELATLTLAGVLCCRSLCCLQQYQGLKHALSK